MVKAASASVEDKAGGPTRTAQAQRKPAERGENDTRERCDVCEGLGEVARCEMRPRPLELQPRQSAIQSGLGLLSRKCKLASAPARSSAAAYYVCPGSGLHVHNLTLQPATCYLLPACHLQSQASFFFTLGPGQTATNGTLIEGMRGRAGRATAADTYRHAPRLALGGAGRAR